MSDTAKLVFWFIVSVWVLGMSAMEAARGGMNGWWELVSENVGVAAMHMAVNHQNKVIIFDRTEFGPSRLRLPEGQCRDDPFDLALKHDCWAHSIEYDIATNSFRPLRIMTDTWCSSGSFLPNGTLLATGGYNDGSRAIRYIHPCSDHSCDWSEKGHMTADRWYATDQILPDGSVIVVGGRRVFSFEFVPRQSDASATFLPFLLETNIPNEENNLYPFVHLSSDGNLFIFAARRSILLDYKRNRVLKTFPDLPGGSRNYPSSGSSVMLPLQWENNFQRVEVLVCGGSPDGAFLAANNGYFMTALADCSRMVITDPKPEWSTENMPAPRVMGDMLLLPTGEVLIINGAEQGTAGWNLARNPSLAPFLYSPTKAAGNRFRVLRATTIPRLYHSACNLLPDGRVLVAGSNPNVGYSFTGVMYPTELRLETYSPYYRSPALDNRRPNIKSLSKTSVGYGSSFLVRFSIPAPPSNLAVNIYAPTFTTHSFSMNQRLLYLENVLQPDSSGDEYVTKVSVPPNAVAAPPGYYMLRVINNGIPSSATWVQFL